MNNQLLISQIEEAPAVVPGEPDCKLSNPFLIKEDNIFHCNVIKEDIIISSGKAESKKKAEQLASKNTLIHYGVLN